MARFEEFTTDSSTGKKLYALQCIPDGPIYAVMQIAHGIGDHIDRYRPFMEYLADNGIASAGNDHLGHGRNITCSEDQGLFSPDRGWMHVVDDLALLHDRTAVRFPGIPYIVFGHSMGSFLMRTYLTQYPDKYDMAILSGTGHPVRAAVKGGSLAADILVRLRGYDSNGRLLEKLAMGSYSSSVKNARTPFDWISSDPAQVDMYIADPMCGFTAKAGVYADLMKGLLYVTDMQNIAKLPAEKPVLFISGKDDPVGEFGKGVERAYDCFRRSGLQDVSIRLYPGGRHEILNETNRADVFRDILGWLNSRLN